MLSKGYADYVVVIKIIKDMQGEALLSSDQNVQVSDTTGDDSSNAAGQKIISDKATIIFGLLTIDSRLMGYRQSFLSVLS